jgi:hypothetical protein
MEIYKEITIAPNYEVSNMGNVRSKKTGKLIATRLGGGKAIRVNLYNHGLICHYVRRLVATEFVSNPHGFTHVIHLDNDPSNCKAENLVWGSMHEYNRIKIEGAYRLYIMSGKQYCGRNFYKSFTEAARHMNNFRHKMEQAWREGDLKRYGLKFERYTDVLRDRKNNLRG